MLTTGELEAMRDTIDASLPDMATIQRATLTSDYMGGAQQAWKTLASNVPCRLSPNLARSGAEMVAGASLVARSDWLVTFTQGQDVTSGDRIRIGARTFEVTLAKARSWELSRRVQCMEVA